jgi:uncharacterized NAD(P)/FAD-binding protein YdhS
MTFVPTPSPGRLKPIDRSDLVKVAIIGRGFTGMMTAIALLKGFGQPFHLVMFDPSPRIDGGEGTDPSAPTLLNSRVRDLSIDPDVTDDFQRWLEADGEWRDQLIYDDVGVEHSFVPGEVFSAYVYRRFSEALRDRTDVVVQVRPETVVAVDRDEGDRFTVSSADKLTTIVDAVFLATGYGTRCPEREEAAPAIAQNTVVMGGGIRAVDCALKLLEEGASHVTLISASGFLPQSHTRAAVGPVSSDLPLPGTLRGAFRFLREAAKVADTEGSGWQGIMNGFRLRARDLWQGLSPAERSRFKRHVRAIYDSHRNRLPPEHYCRLNGAIAQGKISLRKGKVERIATNGVLLSTRSGLEVMLADRLIDCRFRPAEVNSPLFHALFDKGYIRRDEVDLGIVVDRCGRAIGASGHFRGLFAMGPLGIGSLPDIDLVPEIVVQAHAAASALKIWAEQRQSALGATIGDR